MSLPCFLSRFQLVLACLVTVTTTACGTKHRKDEAASVSEQNAVAATDFDDCSGAGWCPKMIRLAGGAATLGSPASEPQRFDDENLKKVTIKPFSIGEYPVTRAQWSAFARATHRPVNSTACAYAPNPHPSWKEPGFEQTDNDPVVCITWDEARDYARWLTEQTGHHYRLPTDDEWEYAARGGTSTAFPWGPSASHAFANYGLDECCGPATSGRDRWEYTSPVGSFPPNPFGLFDMHGNVFEWVETCADAFEKLPLPKDAKGCTYRYARGGVYGDRPAVMRSAAKNFPPPPGDKMTIENYRSAGFGFRVARDS